MGHRTLTNRTLLLLAHQQTKLRVWTRLTLLCLLSRRQTLRKVPSHWSPHRIQLNLRILSPLHSSCQRSILTLYDAGTHTLRYAPNLPSNDWDPSFNQRQPDTGRTQPNSLPQKAICNDRWRSTRCEPHLFDLSSIVLTLRLSDLTSWVRALFPSWMHLKVVAGQIYLPILPQ